MAAVVVVAVTATVAWVHIESVCSPVAGLLVSHSLLSVPLSMLVDQCVQSGQSNHHCYNSNDRSVSSDWDIAIVVDCWVLALPMDHAYDVSLLAVRGSVQS
jgi:hypothetical protein